MESDLQQHHRTHPQPMMNPGLTRFRSAPSSFFASSFDICEEFLNRPSSPETEKMLTRLLSGGNIGDNLEPNLAPNEENNNISTTATTAANQQSQFMGYIKSEAEVLHNNSDTNNYGARPSQSFYHNSAQPPLPNRKVAGGGGGGGSNLIRQSRSPAGFFSNINIDTGYVNAMRGITKFGAANKVGKALLPPLARGSNTNFSSSSRVASSMAQMSMIPEIIGDTGIGSEMQVADGGSFAHDQEHPFFNDFPIESWEDAMSSVTENNRSRSLKRGRSNEDSKPFSASDVQNEEGQGRKSRVPPILAHHLSLPKMLPDISEIEKFLQDSVPCKIRAKRGCATHPRSIAERVRRTKISERIRKLQDLVPNMDKQTNTSDMLDLAVDHIKDLQNQVKMLTVNPARCTCLCRHQL